MKCSDTFVPAALCFSILILWEVLVRVMSIPAYILPPPSAIGFCAVAKPL